MEHKTYSTCRDGFRHPLPR